jgi:gluconolactonase
MPTIVAHGLTFPEGPLHTTDGRTLLVQIGKGEVSEIRDGIVRPAADVRGAPHAVIEGEGGWLYVTQAGNVTIGTNATPDPVPAGIQRVSPGGEISYVVSAEDHPEIRSPNDLCFGPDGRLYFTDTGGSFDPSDATQVGRVFAIDAAGRLETVAELGPVFANGITFDRHGRLLWTETYPGLVCRMENGARRVVADTGNGVLADGVKAVADGRLFVATVNGGCVQILSEDGGSLGELSAGSWTTNCNFRGSTLLVTDFRRFQDQADDGVVFEFPTDVHEQVVFRGRA